MYAKFVFIFVRNHAFIWVLSDATVDVFWVLQACHQDCSPGSLVPACKYFDVSNMYTGPHQHKITTSLFTSVSERAAHMHHSPNCCDQPANGNRYVQLYQTAHCPNKAAMYGSVLCVTKQVIGACAGVMSCKHPAVFESTSRGAV